MKLKYLKEDWWLYLGCYFTGANYEMIRQSSEMSRKHVRKMFSAMLIVMFVWGFIGFSFVNRYMHGNFWMSLIGMLVMILIIIQIERQITMSLKITILNIVFRSMIGIIIAIIGSVIMDQIIFKEDIEIAKHEYLQNKLNKIMPQKTGEIQQQIADLKQQLRNLETERLEIMKEIERQPTIETARVNRSTSRTDTLTGKVESESIYQLARIPNPKIAYLSTIDNKISELNNII
ncbi:MAG: DUF4407 domain-containing protein, partial [Bacteroidales bacterium]|nr:DUF4407 domain-containing protein [Bacteroidales bacterium]